VLLALFLVACIDYGVTRKQELQTWTQPAHEGGVDILWVVDDSLSMDEEQAQLALHATTFVGFLSAAPVDFSLAVTTTDVDGSTAGALTGDLLGPDTPALTDAFTGEITGLPDGSRDEKGLEAALLAADPEGVNAGLMRLDADLAVVVFSDEDDHSGLDAADFAVALAEQRPDSNTALNAIVGDLPEGCASALAAADPGELYVEAQLATGGIRESICAADYDALLERVAIQVIGLETRFYLEKVPELTTMEVRVDGALVHQRDRHGWHYEAGDNSIVFDGYGVPPPGAGIVARYYQWLGHSSADTGEP